MENKMQLDISLQTLLKIFGFIFLVWIVWQIKDIIALFFVVLVIVASLSSVVSKLSKYMPRVVAISIIYLIGLAILMGAFSLILPTAIKELQSLSFDLPLYMKNLLPSRLNITNVLDTSQQGISDIAKSLGGLSGQIYSTTIGFFRAMIGIFTVLVLSFYLLIEERSATNLLLSYIPVQNREKFSATLHKISQKIGGWLRGQLMLGVLVGLIDGVGLAIIGVPYALTLGLFSGLTELIPYVGPIIGAVPAVLIAYFADPVKGLIALILYIAVQQVESQFLVPKIMQKAVGLSPVVIILALLVGAQLAGIAGVILAIPVAATISVVIQEYKKVS